MIRALGYCMKPGLMVVNIAHVSVWLTLSWEMLKKTIQIDILIIVHHLRIKLGLGTIWGSFRRNITSLVCLNPGIVLVSICIVSLGCYHEHTKFLTSMYL